ncbi:MAG: hypothetical protein R3E14_09420 [Erythrobacter sp.]
MDTIKIEQADTRIAVSFRREVGDIRKVRYLSADEAVGLGLLMTAAPPEKAILDFVVNPELSLQVINAPYEHVYLSVRDLHGGRTLVVSMTGSTIKLVGRRLLRLGRRIIDSKVMNVGPMVRPLAHCYLEDAETE